MALIDVTELQKEVEGELASEELKKAKKQLVDIERQIRDAKQLVANLERRKQDLLISISEGTN